MSISDGPRRRFDFGRVIERTFGVIAARPAPLILPALLLVFVPDAIVGWLGMTAEGFGLWTIGTVVSLITGVMLQGVLTPMAVAHFQGGSMDLREGLRVAGAVFPRLLGVAVLAAIGIGLGFIFFVIPGLVLMVLWVVLGPVAVMERNRPFSDIFGRSTELTDGSRWSIFGLMVIYLIAVGAVMTFVGGVFGVAIAPAPSAAVIAVDVVLVPLLGAVMAVISATGAAAIYVELRTLKEGTGVDRASIAAVFD